MPLDCGLHSLESCWRPVCSCAYTLCNSTDQSREIHLLLVWHCSGKQEGLGSPEASHFEHCHRRGQRSGAVFREWSGVFCLPSKRIEGTRDVIWGKRFWDREKGPTPESWEDTQALLQCLPTQQGSRLWLTHNLSITKTKQLPNLSLKKCPWHTC